MRITKEQRETWIKKTANSPFNVWLAQQIRDREGRLDLEKLHSVAKRYGITDVDRYKTLNPGQQRMSIGNRLRSLVDPSEYGVDPQN